MPPNSLPNMMIQPRTNYLSSALCPLHLYTCRESSTNPPLLCKTNPISKTPQITATTVPTKGYENNAGLCRPKTNPNEPKTNPIFRSSGARKAKTNPNEPNFKSRQILPRLTPGAGHNCANWSVCSLWLGGCGRLRLVGGASVSSCRQRGGGYVVNLWRS